MRSRPSLRTTSAAMPTQSSRSSRRSSRAASTSRTSRSPTPRSCCRSSHVDAGSTTSCRPRPCFLVRLALRDQRVERHRDRERRLRLVLELGQLVHELVQQPAHRLDVELRVHLRAAELTVGREEVEAALQLAQLRRLQVARETRRADLLRDLEVLGDGTIGLLAAGRGRELDQAGAVQHPHVEVEVARVDGQRGRELAVRHRVIGFAEHLQHLQPQRVPEGLELLRTLDLQDVTRGGLGLRLPHPAPSLDAAGASRKASMRTGARRTSDAGTSEVISAPKALATASAFSAPVTRKTIRRAERSSGSVMVTRSTKGSSPAGPLTARRSSAWSCGVPGKSEAVCPSGPSPSSRRSSSTPSSALSSSPAASAGRSSPRIRWTSRGCPARLSRRAVFASR